MKPKWTFKTLKPPLHCSECIFKVLPTGVFELDLDFFIKLNFLSLREQHQLKAHIFPLSARIHTEIIPTRHILQLKYLIFDSYFATYIEIQHVCVTFAF